MPSRPNPGRLLVVLEHARQRVETADGPRDVNPYLSPVVDALRGSALEPIEIDLKARVDDDTWWRRLNAPEGARLLPSSAIWRAGEAESDAEDGNGGVEAGSPGSWVASVGVDPDTRHRPRRRPGTGAGRSGVPAGRPLDAEQGPCRHQYPALLRRLRPARRAPGRRVPPPGLADRGPGRGRADGGDPARDDLSLAQRLHAPRPTRQPGRLPIGRTCSASGSVTLLIEASVYRDDEVRVGGSPRLDLAERPRMTDAATPSAPSLGSRRATAWSCCPARGGRSTGGSTIPIALVD